MSSQRNNTIISYSDFIAISEGKQVGTLYHFTRIHNFLKMLEGGLVLRAYYNYISFTRNYNMLDYSKYKNDFSTDLEIGDKRGIRIAIDGDKLSNKYKITPFLDSEENGITRTHGEAEEKIDGALASIKCCIKQIDIIGTDAHYDLVKEHMEKYKLNVPLIHVKKIGELKKVK